MSTTSPARHKVFVSYEHRDQREADFIVGELEAAGIRCWIAHRDMPGARRYGEALLDAIEVSELLLLVFTPRANVSPMVDREVAHAASRGISILPVKIEAVEDADVSRNLKFLIGTHNWLDASVGALSKSVPKITSAVRGLVSQGGLKRRNPAKDVRDHLVVFFTTTQATELWLTKNGLECYLYDFGAGEAQRQWKLSPEDLKTALDAGDVNVKPESRYEDCGVFGVGKYTRWLYSKDLFPEARALREALESLIKAGVAQGKQ